MDGDRGGTGATLDAPGGDDEAGGPGARSWLTGEGDPFELSEEIGGPVGPGEQAAGAGGEGGSDVGRALVVADGDDRDPAVRRQAGQRTAADEGDRHPADQGGGQTGGARIGHHHLPAGGGLDRVAQGVGGSGIVVHDDDQRGRRRIGFEGHGHPPGAWVSAQRTGWPRPARRRKDGRAAGRVEDGPARMCITSPRDPQAGVWIGGFADCRDE